MHLKELDQRHSAGENIYSEPDFITKMLHFSIDRSQENFKQLKYILKSTTFGTSARHANMKKEQQSTCPLLRLISAYLKKNNFTIELLHVFNLKFKRIFVDS